MKHFILCALVALPVLSFARVVKDTGASDPYFKVEGKRVQSEFQATKVILANPDARVEKCTPVKGAMETADGQASTAAYKCKEVDMHISTKGKIGWKAK